MAFFKIDPKFVRLVYDVYKKQIEDMVIFENKLRELDTNTNDKEEMDKPLCVFCNATWSDENVKVYDLSASGGCETCGHGHEITGTVDIQCHACGRLIYSKEFSETPDG